MLAAAGVADGVSQSDLVRATGIDRSTLADLVARMITKGLLERQRSATDARANSVSLSEAGRAALAEGVRPAARSDAKLLGLLPPKKRDAFLKTLSVLADAADGVEPTVKAPKKKTPKVKAEKTAKPGGKKKAKKTAKAET